MVRRSFVVGRVVGRWSFTFGGARSEWRAWERFERGVNFQRAKGGVPGVNAEG
jgi:hypothetical protein